MLYLLAVFVAGLIGALLLALQQLGERADRREARLRRSDR
jgi:hypothetical protein